MQGFLGDAIDARFAGRFEKKPQITPIAQIKKCGIVHR